MQSDLCRIYAPQVSPIRAGRRVVPARGKNANCGAAQEAVDTKGGSMQRDLPVVASTTFLQDLGVRAAARGGEKTVQVAQHVIHIAVSAPARLYTHITGLLFGSAKNAMAGPGNFRKALKPQAKVTVGPRIFTSKSDGGSYSTVPRNPVVACHWER